MEQGALGAAGVRRVWAGAGLQRAVYRGGGHIVRPRAQLVTEMKTRYTHIRRVTIKLFTIAIAEIPGCALVNMPLLLRPGSVASPDNGGSGVQAGSMGRPPPGGGLGKRSQCASAYTISFSLLRRFSVASG